MYNMASTGGNFERVLFSRSEPNFTAFTSKSSLSERPTKQPPI